MPDQEHGATPQVRSRTWARWVFAAFMVITLFLLITEHRAHTLGWILHLFVGACVVLLYLNTRAHESDDQTGGGGPR